MGFRHGSGLPSANARKSTTHNVCGSQRVDAPPEKRVSQRVSIRAWRGWVECVMHGCCGLVMAPTELERTQDMHTATVPGRSCDRSHAAHPSWALLYGRRRKAPSPEGSGACVARNHTPSAEGACKVTRPRDVDGGRMERAPTTSQSATIRHHRAQLPNQGIAVRPAGSKEPRLRSCDAPRWSAAQRLAATTANIASSTHTHSLSLTFAEGTGGGRGGKRQTGATVYLLISGSRPKARSL